MPSNHSELMEKQSVLQMVISKIHKYNNEFNGQIVKESATPMVLKRIFHNMICVILYHKTRHFTR